MPDREKAVKEFVNLLNAAKSNYQDFVDLTVDLGEEIAALLKEHESVKPIRMYHSEHKQTDNYRCGKCGDDIYFEQRFCECCGGAVKWE